MKNDNFLGFKKLDLEEQMSISAGTSTSLINSILKIATTGLSSAVDISDSISDTVIKNKIISKMDEVQKGEVELNKNGIRLKWDSLSSNINPTKIIF
ncbi:MAG: hypothetical protein IKB83_00870 [Mycoplasmataceae bacterium]|nr:hypothetical protein [Mycoplasmataceae bacterium]MBR2998950.1 hypothetical protein [Mycoplasmataceae bacterium]MBR3259378.1 hypothetical protein [Mycoplasmataceae bacterium]